MIIVDDNIWLLDPNKANGLDKICILILKICGNCISKLLALIFHDCLEKYILWNVKVTLSLYMKGDKHNIENYHLISLLPIYIPIYSRIFEKLSKYTIN